MMMAFLVEAVCFTDWHVNCSICYTSLASVGKFDLHMWDGKIAQVWASEAYPRGKTLLFLEARPPQMLASD